MAYPSDVFSTLQPPTLGRLRAKYVELGEVALAAAIGGGCTTHQIRRALARGYVPDAFRALVDTYLDSL